MFATIINLSATKFCPQPLLTLHRLGASPGVFLAPLILRHLQVPELVPGAAPERSAPDDVHLPLLQSVRAVHRVVARLAHASQDAVVKVDLRRAAPRVQLHLLLALAPARLDLPIQRLRPSLLIRLRLRSRRRGMEGTRSAFGFLRVHRTGSVGCERRGMRRRRDRRRVSHLRRCGVHEHRDERDHQDSGYGAHVPHDRASTKWERFGTVKGQTERALIGNVPVDPGFFELTRTEQGARGERLEAVGTRGSLAFRASRSEGARSRASAAREAVSAADRRAGEPRRGSERSDKCPRSAGAGRPIARSSTSRES